TGICTTVSLPVLQTNSVVPAPLKASPLAPNGGTPVVVSSASAFHAAIVAPPGGVRQITPWKESEMYTLPAASKVSTFGPAAAPPGIVTKGLEAPVNGFTVSTCLAPKSITSSAPVVGWNARSRSRLLEPATLRRRSRRPDGL